MQQLKRELMNQNGGSIYGLGKKIIICSELPEKVKLICLPNVVLVAEKKGMG